MASKVPDQASAPEAAAEQAPEASPAEAQPQPQESAAAEASSEPEPVASAEDPAEPASEGEPLPTHIPMIHPEGGSTDLYQPDKKGIIQVAIEDIETLLAHGFVPASE